jgi:F-type H+-transporting ATPase subunit delta
MSLRGASAEAFAALTDELAAVAASGEAAASAATGLFSSAQALRGEAALRRFATDVAVPAEAKQGLVREVFGPKVSEAALSVLTSAVGRRWTVASDLAGALETLSEIATVRSADDVDRLIDELFTLERAVQDNSGLRDALSDPARSTADKEGLVESLLAGKALPATVTLAKQAVAGTYRTVSAALATYQKVAAGVRNEGVATVRVARELTDAQAARLAEGLSKHYGRPVHLNLLVDPAVVGGIKVEIGDDVIDGSIASRLDDARRTIAG